MSDLNLLMRIGVKEEQVVKTLDQLSSEIKRLEVTARNTSSSASSSFKNTGSSLRDLAQESEKAGSKIKSSMDEAKRSSDKASSGFDKLSKEIQGLNITAGTLQKTLGVIGGILSVGLIVQGFKNISRAAMDAVESENLFVVSLGNMADEARRWSEITAKALGLNAYQIRENLGVLAVMLNSMGLSEAQAYDMAKAMTKLTYDLSSFYNLSHEEAFNKIKSGITGETEPLKALGIILNETTVKAVAYANGIAEQGKELTEVQKIQARYIALMEQTQKAQGDLERTADSTSNMMKRMDSTLEDLSVTMGETTLPALNELVKELLKFIANVKTFVESHGPDLTAIFNTLAQSVISLGNAFNGFNADPFIYALKVIAADIAIVTAGVSTLIGSLKLLWNAAGRGLKTFDYNKVFKENQKQLQQDLKGKPDLYINLMAHKATQSEERRFQKQKTEEGWKGLKEDWNSIWENNYKTLESIAKLSESGNAKKVQTQQNVVNIPKIKNSNLSQTVSGNKKSKAEFTLLDRYEKDAYKTKRLNDLSKSDLGLKQPELKFNTAKYDENKLKNLGLTDKDIELVKLQASKMYASLKNLDDNYSKFKSKSQKRAHELYKDANKDLAEAQVEYELKLKEIQESKTGTKVQKAKAAEYAKDEFEDKQSKIKENYLKKLTEINQRIIEEDKDLAEKRNRIVKEEAEKQLQIRSEAEMEIRQLKINTNKILQDTENQKALLSAQLREDEIALINAEAKIKRDNINAEIDLQKIQTEERIKEIEKFIKEQGKIILGYTF